MRFIKWLGLLAVVTLVVFCFQPWITIVSRDLTITGMDTEGTSFGKPGFFHLLMSVFFTAFTLIPRVWAKRANLLIVALNVAWAVRNFFLISICAGGECPRREAGIYLILLCSVLMFVSALLPDVKLKNNVSSTKDTKDTQRTLRQ